MEGLTYHYPDTGMGIRDVSLHLKRGTLTLVTGRIGAGKTTFLRVLLGLLPKGLSSRQGVLLFPMSSRRATNRKKVSSRL